MTWWCPPVSMKWVKQQLSNISMYISIQVTISMWQEVSREPRTTFDGAVWLYWKGVGFPTPLNVKCYRNPQITKSIASPEKTELIMWCIILYNIHPETKLLKSSLISYYNIVLEQHGNSEFETEIKKYKYPGVISHGKNKKRKNWALGWFMCPVLYKQPKDTLCFKLLSCIPLVHQTQETLEM